MANMITMPKLGLTMTEGIVVKWHKRAGDPVKIGDILFEVETDKMITEVEADCDGEILSIIAGEGETVPCMQPVAYIGEAGETIPQTIDTNLKIPAKREKKLKKAEHIIPIKTTEQEGYVRATPVARKLAQQSNIDLADIPATGPESSVVLRDVEAYKNEAPLKAEKAVMVGGNVTMPLTGVRKTIARRMSESWSISPRVCYEMPVDCTAIKKLRAKFKKDLETKKLKLTYNHLLIFVLSRALVEFPELNSTLDGDKLLLHSAVNIGIAVNTERGLFVPNLKGCEKKGLVDISEGAEDMIKRAREGRLDMAELTGGTFTITNLGMFGMRSFSPIINQPEAAILGVNAIIDTPVVSKEGRIEARPIMNLNLVADHRIVDGSLAAQFLNRVVVMLETPALMLI